MQRFDDSGVARCNVGRPGQERHRGQTTFFVPRTIQPPLATVEGDEHRLDRGLFVGENVVFPAHALGVEVLNARPYTRLAAAKPEPVGHSSRAIRRQP